MTVLAVKVIAFMDIEIYPERVTQQSLGSPHCGAPQVTESRIHEPQRGSTMEAGE